MSASMSVHGVTDVEAHTSTNMEYNRSTHWFMVKFKTGYVTLHFESVEDMHKFADNMAVAVGNIRRHTH